MASIDSFSLSDRLFSCFPSIAQCLPITLHPSSNDSNNQPTPELQGLLSNSADDYDDSDAISLLSNIADSDSSRRNRRRRNRLRREGGVTSQLLACGLFGRSKGQIQRSPVTVGSRRQRSSQRELGASGDESDGGDDSDRAGTSSLRDVDSGDEDAGMLKDDAIAKLGQGQGSQQDQDGDRSRSVVSSSKSKSKSKKQQAQEQEEQDRKAALEEDERLALEESRLAQEEEAAIAKARRKAERRAAKAGLLKIQHQASERRSRGGDWRTEAGAEAAAGGFHFAEEGGNDRDDFYYGNGNEQRFDGDEAYDTRYQEGVEHDYQFEPHQPVYDQQEQIIHHHHHYYNPSPEQPVNPQSSGLLSPSEFSSLPALPSPTSVEDRVLDGDPAEEDEDEADIAGLSFGKKKKKTKRTDSQSGGSGNGSRGGSSSGGNQHLVMGRGPSSRRPGESFPSGSHSGSGNGSANGRSLRGIPGHLDPNEREISPTNNHHPERPPSSSSSNSSSGRASYRDRPRRHERTSSKSTNTSSRDGHSKMQLPSPNNPSSSTSDALSPNSDHLFSSPNLEQTIPSPSTLNTFPNQLHSSPNLAPEESDEFNYSKFSNAYKSKARKGGKSGGENSSSGSSSAAASRRARGIPPINEESTSSLKNPDHDSTPFGGGLTSSRNPTGANAWSRYNQGSSGRKLEEEEVDGL